MSNDMDVETAAADPLKQEEEIDISPEDNGGLFKKVLREGKGTERPPKGADVKVHYVGTLLDGSKFDSSRDRGDPFSFKLGTGAVIKGWDIGVATMRKGELAVLKVRSDFGYGDAGSPPKIPGGATLLFEVELLSWESGTDISDPKTGALIKHVTTESAKSWEHPQEDARVTIRLHSSRIGDTVVRSAVDVSFILGAEEVSPLYERAASKMGHGERATFDARAPYIAPEELSALSNAPSGAEVKYDLELVDFEKIKSSWELSSAEKLATADRLKQEGNDLFKTDKLSRAMSKYKRALSMVEYDSSLDEGDKPRAKELKLSLLSNQAAVQLKQKDYREVIATCKKVLETEPQNAKALFRRGQAWMALVDWEQAERDFRRVAELCPEDKAVQKELEALGKKKKAQDQKDKKVFSKMFSE